MLRRLIFGFIAISALVSGGIAWRMETTNAGPKTGGDVPPNRNEEPSVDNKSLKPTTKLPITQVVLFNSGVGYFSRSGEVEGEARVDLQFSATDINDLIKSLVVHDAKGKVLPLRYDSQEPIEKTLQSFAINLSSNPSFGQILNQMVGQKIELTLQSTNTTLPNTLTGTIISMETSQRPHSPTATTLSEMELLNLNCAEGIRSVPITQIQRMRFLNPVVESELRRALEVVAIGRDNHKKTVHLGFRGEGKREIKVGYVVENPIWKTTYRVVLDANKKPRLLAWANIENTSDEDWQDVKLTLVSSRPISFQMDLYPPLFIPRPTVEPALFASLRVPTYQGPLTNAINNPNFAAQGGAGFGGGGFAGNGTNNLQVIPQNGVFAQQAAQAMNPTGNLGGFQGGQFGIQGGNGQLGFQNSGQQLNVFSNNRYNRDANTQVAQQKLTYEELQQRRKDNQVGPNGKDPQAIAKAQQIGSVITGVDPDFVERALAAEELGNATRYVLEEKIHLPRQQSAMIPVLDQEIDATRVSIYNERVHAKHPLNGMKLKNTSKQALMQGPITVYDGDQYSGDARLMDLQPGEDRFISYAVDSTVEIKPYTKTMPGPEMTVKMENGQLQVQYKHRRTRTYVIVNRSPEARNIVLEQPVQDGWKLVVPEKAYEQTRDLYRFNVSVEPGKTVRYEVSEELPRMDPFAVSKQADWTGFATTLGLDVWTENSRTPEDTFFLQEHRDGIQVTHKDRRSTKYFIRNRSEEERTIWLEHHVPAERKLIGNVEPADKSTQRYRFKLPVKPNETVTQFISEELNQAKPELFALKTLDPGTISAAWMKEIPQSRIITELGFEAWIVRKKQPDTLTHAKFIKGDLHTTNRDQEITTFHILNRTNPERNFIVAHNVRSDWNIVGDQKPVEGSELRYHFPLKGTLNQIVRQEIVESRTVIRKEPIQELLITRYQTLMDDAPLSKNVKENLKKAMDMRLTLERNASSIKALENSVKSINEEQARLRTNMEKLPPTSELFKRYLDKLDKQETTLEEVQKQIKDLNDTTNKLQKENNQFLQNLNVD